MDKKKLLALIAKKEARKAELNTKANASEDVKELRSINTELEGLNGEIAELRSLADSMPDEKEPEDQEKRKDDPTPLTPEEIKKELEKRKADPAIVNMLASFGVEGGKGEKEDRSAKLKEESEKRGKDLLEGRSVTVGSSNIVVPKYNDNVLNPAFNEVSSLIDRVSTKPLVGGESYRKGYVAGYGTGDYTTEGTDAADAEPTFAYADINKTKITAYAEDTNEILKLSAANYDGEVMNGVRIAIRKKASREILVGTGATNHMVGIFSALATAIDPATDLPIAAITEDTLDDIIFGYGGDENVEDAAVLILSKKDLKAFSKLRDANGKKVHTIVTRGNSGTIDTIPYIINSACYSIADGATSGQYCMAYGPLSNYLMTIFSDMDVQRSTDYKFKAGMIAHRGEIYVGGNVVSKNGFLRVKKA